MTRNNKHVSCSNRFLFSLYTVNVSFLNQLRQEWDLQLEDVACQYVKYCQMSSPAQCLATQDYDLPGQSVFHMYRDKKSTNHAPILTEAVRNWFDQSSAASSDIIDYYENK